MKNTWDIRPLPREEIAARIDDFVAVAKDVPREYWTQEHFLRELPQKWQLSLAAWLGNRPVGYAILSRRTRQRAHLHHFMVAGDLRRQGLGEALLNAAICNCTRLGYAEISLKVAIASEGAQRFYRRHGFAVSGGDGAYREMLRSLRPRTVTIHQPNYAPWLGYFAKMARADVFIFLDDAQYTKNSYINRVQIDAGGIPRWLTVPVSYRFGDSIGAVRISDADWRRSHLDTLKTYYAHAAHFGSVWTWLSDVYAGLPDGGLAASNQALIEALAAKLGIGCRFLRSSDLDLGAATGDDRLIALLRSAGGGVRYLSGKGGSNYQDPAKFAAAGIDLTYSEFVHPAYDQGHETFLPGLSIFDALFRIGLDRTAAHFVAPGARA